MADERDPSADAMVLELEERGVEAHRLDTAWFPAQLSLSARLRAGRWAGHLRTEHRTVELEAIHAIWYRSPKAYRFPPELNTVELDHAKVEAKYGLGGVLMSLPVLWINHPSRLADSAYKPFQLAVAARCGLNVADTLITNSKASVQS
ncbi:MAG: MvdC/MvdD family ATP grasp protein, partial [Sciscionella sp.]